MIEVANIGLFTAFAAGLVSFASPCVLPLVPGYISYVAGRSHEDLRSASREARFAALGQAIWFVLGFSTVFVILGASSTYIGRWLLAYKQEATALGGGIIILFGLFMTGVLKPQWLQMDSRWLHRVEGRAGPSTSYVLGLAFAFGWTPCIGPILGAILTVSATGASNSGGITLLSVYSFGLGVPFMLTAVFLDRFLRHRHLMRRWGRWLHMTAGVVMIVMGVAMITGRLTALSYWLLETFPFLTNIG